MSPTFSVIMTSFNYAQYVGVAIESVLAQTFEDWELLVVDDCSTDDSWNVITSFTDPRIKAFRQVVNSGASAAYNLALSKAQGRYVACLDSDDVFMPTKLEKQAAFFVEHPNVGICGSFVAEIDKTGQAIVGSTSYADWFNTALDLSDPSNWLWSNHLCHSSAVVRRELHDQLGGLANHLVYTPDWQFWLRALVQGAIFKLIEQPLVGYRNHGDNITHKNKPAMVLEHAVTSASVLMPWLEQISRNDLFEDLVEGFLEHSALNDDAQLLDKVFEQFTKSPAARTARSVQSRLVQKILTELRADKEWLATQLENHEKQSQIQLLEIIRADKEWMATQLDKYEQQSTRKINELTDAKDWLLAQVENHKVLNQKQFEHLSAAKDWLVSQSANQEKMIQELNLKLVESITKGEVASQELDRLNNKNILKFEKFLVKSLSKFRNMFQN